MTPNDDKSPDNMGDDRDPDEIARERREAAELLEFLDSYPDLFTPEAARYHVEAGAHSSGGDIITDPRGQRYVRLPNGDTLPLDS